MNNTAKTIAFSNGRWVSAKALCEHLGVSSVSKTPLGTSNMYGLRDVSFEVHKNGSGEVVRYRAYSTKGKTPVELAKLRKAFGMFSGIESISILRGAQ